MKTKKQEFDTTEMEWDNNFWDDNAGEIGRLNSTFASRILNEGTVIEDFWHLDRFPGRHSVEFEGKYYTVYRDHHGYPHHAENGCDKTPVLSDYLKTKRYEDKQREI